MHAFLITKGNLHARREYISALCRKEHINVYDIFSLDGLEKSIGIEDVRLFQTHLNRKPMYGTKTIAIIYNAHTLTIEAQNALLKTLEEPPPALTIILETDRAAHLLPTVLSRCQIIRLAQTPFCDTSSIVPQIQQIIREKSIGKKLQMMETITTTRENTLAWIEQSIQELRTILYNYYKSNLTPQSSSTWSLPDLYYYLRNLLNAFQFIEQNVSYKTVLDSVFYSMI